MRSKGALKDQSRFIHNTLVRIANSQLSVQAPWNGERLGNTFRQRALEKRQILSVLQNACYFTRLKQSKLVTISLHVVRQYEKAEIGPIRQSNKKTFAAGGEQSAIASVLLEKFSVLSLLL